MDRNLDGIEVVFLDLDGTLYLGEELIEGVEGFLERLETRGIRRYFLSNNSSRSTVDYQAKLSFLGINARLDEILLSTNDLISWLIDSNYKRIFLVGTASMKQMLQENGIEVVSENPAIVVLGYDTEIDYEKLSNAVIHLHRGVPLVASHPDVVCPSPDGGLPDVGAYLALLEASTGVRPVHICGKPNQGMIGHKIAELGLDVTQVAMVGDRLYTDIEMADRVGCIGVLVLSGEASRDDVGIASQVPDVIVDSVADLLR